VNRLRVAEQSEFVKTIVELAAKADDGAMTIIACRVDAIAGNNFDRTEPAKKSGGPVTFRAFAERWTGGELARLYPDHVEEKCSVQDDIERLEKHVYPHVEDVPLVSFSREHADGVMAKIPSTLKRGTRRQVAQVMNRVLRLAVFAEEIKASPLPPGWLPKAPKAESIAKESLLPSEEAKSCSAERAPKPKRSCRSTTACCTPFCIGRACAKAKRGTSRGGISTSTRGSSHSTKTRRTARDRGC
jgi:hypothetical protein